MGRPLRSGVGAGSRPVGLEWLYNSNMRTNLASEGTSLKSASALKWELICTDI